MIRQSKKSSHDILERDKSKDWGL